MDQPPVAAPSIGEQLLYLSGLRHAHDNDRLWLQQVLTTTPPFKLGVLTMLPNALLLMAFGLFSLAFFRDNTLSYIWLIGAPVMVLIGALAPALTRTRVNRLLKKNSLPQI